MTTYNKIAATRAWWSLTGEIAGFAGRLFKNLKARRALRELLEHDDRMLDDIGVTRGEIKYALSLPLTENPARRLRAEAGLRRRARDPLGRNW